MQIKELEMNPWELAEFNENNFLDLPEQDTLLLIWMPLRSSFFDHGIYGYILNIIAPKDSCFWNLDFHNAFNFFIKIPPAIELLHQSKNILIDFVKETGEKPDSFFAEIWLQDLTRDFGDDFRYQKLNSSYARTIISMFRKSIFVQVEHKPYLSSYFIKQLEVFGETAFLKYDLRKFINALNENTYSEVIKQHRLFFRSFLAGLKPTDIKKIKHNLIDIIDEFNQIPKEILLYESCYSVNLAHISPMEKMVFYNEFYDDLREIFLNRANWVINHSTIRQIEHIKSSISSSSWGDLPLVDLRNELRKRVDIILADFPIIQTNPYELFMNE